MSTNETLAQAELSPASTKARMSSDTSISTDVDLAPRTSTSSSSRLTSLNLDPALSSDSSPMRVDLSFKPDNKTILIVDDSAIQRKVLTKMLQYFAYKTLDADSVASALDILNNKTSSIDLVLCDVQMPEQTGHDLLKQMRKDTAFKHIPVILMSAVDTSGNSADTAIKNGSEDYLFKPVGKHILQKKVQQVLMGHHLHAHATAFAEQLGRQHREIEQLQTTVDTITGKRLSVLDSSTPLQRCTLRVANLINEGRIKDQVAVNELREILAMLSAPSKMDRPAFMQSLNSHKTAFNETTRSWLEQFKNTGDDSTSKDEEKKSAAAAAMNASGGARRPSSSDGTLSSHYAKLASWDYNVIGANDEQLMSDLVAIFEYFELPTRFNFSKSKLGMLVAAAANAYNDKPYHNFMHAFDVTQALFSMLVSMDGARFLDDLDVLALLTAAFLHDVGHPGRSNAFQVAAGTELAYRYNDQSVLEHYHASTAFELLRRPECNIFESLSKEEFKRVRHVMIRSILGTDMAQHFEISSRFQNRMASGLPYSDKNPEERVEVAVVLLKAADISNVARNSTLAKEWNERVAEEFFEQGDYERAHGFPVAPHLDRTKMTRPAVSKNFIQFVARAFFESFSQLLEPKGSLLMDNVQSNFELFTVMDRKASSGDSSEGEASRSASPSASASSGARKGSPMAAVENDLGRRSSLSTDSSQSSDVGEEDNSNKAQQQRQQRKRKRKAKRTKSGGTD